METVNGLRAPPAALPWGNQDQVHPHHLFHPRPFRTLADVGFATAGWVDRYDNRRLHGSLGILAPVEFKTLRYEVLTREPAPTKQRENPGRFRALAGHRLTARRRTTGCWTQDTLSVLVGSPDSVHRWTESGEPFGVSSTGPRARRAHSGRATESDGDGGCGQLSRSASGNRSAWAASSSSVISRAFSSVSSAAVNGSSATAWWTFSTSPSSAARTARVCTFTLVRFSAASCGGRSPIAVGWTPRASTRQGTSTQVSSGRFVMRAPLLGTLPCTTLGVPVTIEFTMLAPYSTLGASSVLSLSSWASMSPW